MTDQLKTVIIEDNKYNIEDAKIPNHTRIFISRVQELEINKAKLNMQLQENNVLIDSYMNELKEQFKDAKPILQQDSKTEGNSGKES